MQTIPRTGSSWDKPFLRIGHGGAAGHARPNSLRSLTLALELGVEVVEFDVRACRDGLVLLHDDNLAPFGSPRWLGDSTLADLRGLPSVPDGPLLTLVEALEMVKGRALLNVDLKAAGYEDAVLHAVCARGMLGDVLFSSLIPASLQRLKQIDPAARTGLSYPEDRPGAPNLAAVASAVVILRRLLLPYRILSLRARAGADSVMLNHRVVSRPTVKRVHRAGGKVYAWTVDDAAAMRRLRLAGVDGIASNYPELFAQL